MYTKPLVILVVGCSALFAGCSVHPSPSSTRTGSPMGPAQVAIAGLGTAGGAMIGHEIGGNKGAVIGGAAGLLTGALAANVASNYYADRLDEAREEGRREVRLKEMNDYWEGQTSRLDTTSDHPRRDSPNAPVNYPAGVYEGVKYGPRVLPRPATHYPSN